MLLPNVENVVIVGTGLMASGIAQVAIETGFQVTMVGRSLEKCQGVRSRVILGLGRTAKRKFANDTESQRRFIDSLLVNLKLVTDITSADLEHADMVIEAVVENLKVKQKLFTDLEQLVSDHCLLVTNTSSFLLEDVSSKMELLRENFAGLHFFNPVPAMKLVEVVRGNETSDEAFDSLFLFCQQLGKTPVKCKDCPGFIVNRLLMPYLADAMKLVERGDADVKDVDTAMRLGAGHPMGPFELMDYIGLDTMQMILDGWHQREPEEKRYSPCESLENLVKAGKLGRKTNEGFHKYAK